ncbi:MAG: RHS repeat-associated core domain-containing protein [Acidobacteriia bacterium]|nr:RHS repeat-associated core domain-containing protein [Terriglobia bacterium]
MWGRQLGQRVEKKTGTAYTDLVYDAFGSPIGSYDNSGWGAYYVPFNGRIFVKYQDQKTYFLHPNGLGSTTFVTDQTQTGATIQKTLYYPWGQLWASSALVKDNRFASLGQRDAETGNDPTLFRMYNPRLYRWLSPDPLAGDILNPQSLNRYAYVLNNPVNFIDPLGLYMCWDPATNWFCGLTPDTPDGQGGGAGDSFGNSGRVYAPVQDTGTGREPGRAQQADQSKGDAVQAATTYCQDLGQIAFDVPFTNIPVTMSLSFTVANVNYGLTNDITAVAPALPIPPFVSFGGSLDFTVNAPKTPAPTLSVGAGKNFIHDAWTS